MSDRERRAAENEALFRRVNERIEDTALRRGTVEDMVEFLCECDRMDCERRVQLTVWAYENVRAEGDQFVVVPEHVNADVEDVIDRVGDSVIVRKIGEGAQVARESDPRT